MESTSRKRGIAMKVNGRTIWQMVRDKLSILMEVVITDSFSTTGGMVKVSSCKKVVSLKDILFVINFRDKEPCRTRMDKSFVEVGRIMKNMVKDSTLGQMETHTKDSIDTVCEMGTGS